jgi:hypothetical protein
LHAWEIFDEFQLINILVIQQTCIAMVRDYNFYIIKQYTWKHVMTVKRFIVNKMYKTLSSHIFHESDNWKWKTTQEHSTIYYLQTLMSLPLNPNLAAA